MYFSGIREWFFSRRVKFDSGFNVMAVYEASRHGPKVVYRFTRHPEVSHEVVEETLLILQESQRDRSPWIGRRRIKVDVLSSWSPPEVLFRPSAIGKNKFSLFGKYHLFRIESFRVDFRCVHSFQLLKVCDQYVHPSKFSPRRERIRGTIPGKTFFPNSWIRDWSFAVIGWYSTNEPNGIIGPLNGCPQNVFHRASSHQKIGLWRFADRCNVFHGICPPTFHLDPIATIQQRVPSFTLRTALSAIPLVLRSVWCGRAMIPGEIFTSFAEFQGIVSVNDFCGFLSGSSNFCKLLWVFLWSLVFARIRLDPLGG